MKRDMDLVRCILLQVEQAESDVPLANLTCEKWSVAEVAYHIDMMQAHGLVDATMHRGSHGAAMLGEVHGLRWDGADHLDAIRDDGVWAKTKRLVKEAVGSTTMAVIKDAACMVATQAIKSKLGIQ